MASSFLSRKDIKIAGKEMLCPGRFHNKCKTNVLPRNTATEVYSVLAIYLPLTADVFDKGGCPYHTVRHDSPESFKLNGTVGNLNN